MLSTLSRFSYSSSSSMLLIFSTSTNFRTFSSPFIRDSSLASLIISPLRKMFLRPSSVILFWNICISTASFRLNAMNHTTEAILATLSRNRVLSLYLSLSISSILPMSLSIFTASSVSGSLVMSILVFQPGEFQQQVTGKDVVEYVCLLLGSGRNGWRRCLYVIFRFWLASHIENTVT
mgnify:CR=1 FL=1